MVLPFIIFQCAQVIVTIKNKTNKDAISGIWTADPWSDENHYTMPQFVLLIFDWLIIIFLKNDSHERRNCFFQSWKKAWKKSMKAMSALKKAQIEKSSNWKISALFIADKLTLVTWTFFQALYQLWKKLSLSLCESHLRLGVSIWLKYFFTTLHSRWF